MEYQDALAALGVGSAHPGGFDTTLFWMREILWTASMRVLDVGCGTGRTLAELQRRTGCHAVGVDLRPKMIQKAKQRCKSLGIPAQFAVGNAESLPFSDSEFDVVFTESVNVFVDVSSALREYFRVLKPGGWYVDVEMLVQSPVSPEWKASALKVYGAKHVPDQSGWKRYYQNAGFQDVRVLGTRPVLPQEMMVTEQKHPDEVNLADKQAYSDRELLGVLSANAEWMEKNHHWLGYGVFLMRRP